MSEVGHVRFGDASINYYVARSRRRKKTIEITIEGQGVRVAAPITTSADEIRALVRKRAPWIIRRANAESVTWRSKEFVSGESLPYLGRQVLLFVEPSDRRHASVKFDHWTFRVAAPNGLVSDERIADIRRAFTDWYRRRAAQRLAKRVERWAPVVGERPAAVLVRNQRQRWASCGPDGTLRFNWRIVMAEPALLDYVVVHELVHLGTKNHSSEFWGRVGGAIPDYRIRRQRLKALGPSLAI